MNRRAFWLSLIGLAPLQAKRDEPFVITTAPGQDAQGNAVTLTTLTLVNYPDPGVFRNGLRQKVGTDYTVAGVSITFTAAAQVQPDDTFTVDL